MFAIAIGGGALAATLYLSILAGGPGAIILAYLTQLPLFLVALSLGVVPAAAASATAAILVAVVTGGLLGFVAFVVTNGLPTVLAAAQALRWRDYEGGGRSWYSAGHILAQLAAYGSIVVVAIALLFAGENGFEASVRRLIEAAMSQFAISASDDIRTALIDMLASFMPGAATAWWLLMVIGNATLAIAVLARFGKSLRPKPAYAEIEMPGWTAYVLVGVLMLAVIGRGTPLGYIAFNLLPIWVLAYGLVGLATIHFLSRQWRQRGLALGALYAAMFIVGWPIILVAGFGFIEQWACFRRQSVAAAARRD
jgi:hypothetical protein